jgi:hypothetical protein
MNRSELHYTTRRAMFYARARNWLTATATVAALLGVYAVVDLHDRNTTLSNQVAGFQSRGCPETFAGKRFTFSAYETVDLTRPKYARLACYYAKATVQS